MKSYKHIVILSGCNLKCSYCGGPSYSIDVDKSIDCIDRILKKNGPDNNCFRVNCKGEISLYPKIIEFLQRKASEGYMIEIVTNGLLIEDIIGSDNNLRLVISLDGHTEEMNREKQLDQKQVDKILNVVLKYNAEIQCVYYKQTVDQVNDFIHYLLKRKFKTFLHIFPCILNGKHASGYIDYDLLVKTDFLPPKDFFERWRYVYENSKRNFICDRFINGYAYFIADGNIIMVKCDDSRSATRHIHSFGDERDSSTFPCDDLCINHNEYNNIRSIVNS